MVHVLSQGGGIVACPKCKLEGFVEFLRSSLEGQQQEQEQQKEQQHGKKAKSKKPTKKQYSGKKVKRPKGKNAFMYFTMDARKSIIEEHPNLSFGEVGREVGVRWRALEDSAKKKYEALAVIDMARVKKEVEEAIAKEAPNGVSVTPPATPKSSAESKDPKGKQHKEQGKREVVELYVEEEGQRDEEFEVEAIVDERMTTTGKRAHKEVLVRWRGYSPAEDTWCLADS